MVNHVVRRAELEATTLEIATIEEAFALHHEGHAAQRRNHGVPVDPAGFDVVRSRAAVDRPRARD